MGQENILPSVDTYFDPEIMEGMIRETFGLESETTGERLPPISVSKSIPAAEESPPSSPSPIVGGASKGVA